MLNTLNRLTGKNKPEHVWRFYRSGGFDQVRLDTLDDLLNLDQLDQKLWVALSCPSKGLQFDPRTLAALDEDRDGYIRAQELIQALQWTAQRLAEPSMLLEGASPLPLSAIATEDEEGRQLRAAAEQILAGLGKPDATEISCADTENSQAALTALPLNGDGIVTPTSTNDPDLQALITLIIETCPGPLDRSGQAGVDKALAEQFFATAEALSTWREMPSHSPSILPLGEHTASAFALLQAVRDKVEDYFTRCQLSSFDPRAAELLNPSTDTLKSLSTLDLAADMAAAKSAQNSQIATLPLACIAANAPLPLSAARLNPAWADAVMALSQQVIEPLLGQRTELSQADWQALNTRLIPFAEWQASQPETPLASIPAVRLNSLCTASSQGALSALIAADQAMSASAERIACVDRLVRFTRDLTRLARNFASFQNFYSGTEKALFQSGTLYLDGRSCDLCIQVLDPAKHATLAALSGIYLAYCDCVRGENGVQERMTIAAAFTDGDADQLMVGRNGLFYDRQGRDWQATITRLVEHPISLRQAFWSPYKKLVRLIQEQIQKIASAKEKLAEGVINQHINQAGQQAQQVAQLPSSKAAAAPAPTNQTPFDVARFAGIFAAIGLAVGALGTALATLLHSFLSLTWWQMPLAMIGLMVVISGPAVLLAVFKLRNRNLGPLLDANGWAINSRARINLPFGRSLTQMATLPQGAERSLHDPYAEKKIPWLRYGLLSGVAAGALIYLRIFWL